MVSSPSRSTGLADAMRYVPRARERTVKTTTRQHQSQLHNLQCQVSQGGGTAGDLSVQLAFGSNLASTVTRGSPTRIADRDNTRRLDGGPAT